LTDMAAQGTINKQSLSCGGAMLVQNILKGKSSNEITTIAPDASVSDAAGLLSAKKIGVLVVSNGGDDVQGMFSERDIVRELGAHGVSCLARKVSEIMTRTIVSCTKDERADAILRKMTNGRFRHMPVMEGDKMIGLVSIGDVVQARLSEMAMENEAMESMIKGF